MEDADAVPLSGSSCCYAAVATTTAVSSQTTAAETAVAMTAACGLSSFSSSVAMAAETTASANCRKKELPTGSSFFNFLFLNFPYSHASVAVFHTRYILSERPFFGCTPRQSRIRCHLQ